MKSHSILFAAVICGLGLAAHAEEAAAPATIAPAAPAGGTLQPLQTPDLMLAPTPEAVVTPAPAADASASVSVAAPAPLKKGTAEQLRQAIRIRELKTVVEEDPQVCEQKATADHAKTEEGRRVAMRNYYTLLYTKIEKIDPSLEGVLEQQLRGILMRYEQRNVCPSVLIEPIIALPDSNSADHGEAGEKSSDSSSKKKGHKR